MRRHSVEASAQRSTMEESVPASMLVLAGLLRLAGVSQSEPWSSHPADQAFLEEGLATAETHLVSASEEGATEGTRQFDSFTSNLTRDDISHSWEDSGTQAEVITGEEDQLLAILATARQPERSGQSLDVAVAGHQSDASSTGKPLTDISALTGVPESKAESSSLSKHLAKFLPREEGAGNSTAWELMSMIQATPIPSKSVVELLATLIHNSDSSESTGQQVTLSTSLSPKTAPGNLHFDQQQMFTVIKNKAEEFHDKIIQTSAKESLEKLLTLSPKSSQPSQVEKSQPPKPDVGSSDVFRTADLLTQAQSPSAKVRFSTLSQQALSEEHVAIIPRTKMAQHSSFSSSPHREMKENKITDRGKTENPTLLPPSQSNTHPSPSFSTPGTLSWKASSQSAFSGDTGQSSLSKLVFSSQFPSFSKSAASTKMEKQAHECMNMPLHHDTDPQSATQAPNFKLPQTAALLGGPQPVSQMKETTIVESAPADSKPQPSGVLPPVRGKPLLRIPSRTPMANLISSHVSPTMLAAAAPSKVGSPSRLASAAAAAAAGDISQFLSKFQLPATPSSVYGKKPFPSTIVPPLTGPEAVAISSVPATTKQQTFDIHSGVNRLTGPTPPHVEPVITSALAHTKSPGPGNSALWHAGLSTSAVIDSAPSRLKPPASSGLADGELQESVFGLSVPYQAEQRMGANSGSRSTASAPHIEPDAPGEPVVARLSIPGTSVLNHPSQKWSADVLLPSHAKTPSLLTQVFAKSKPPARPVPAYGEPSVNIPGTNVPLHVRSQVPGISASFTDESYLPVTPAPTHDKPKINEAPAVSSLPISTDIAPQRTSISVSIHTKAQSLLLSAHAPTEHPLSDASAKLGAQHHNETRAPKASSSPPAHLQLADVVSHGQLRPEPSSTTPFVDTNHQSSDTSTSVNAGTQTPIISMYVHPGLQLHATTPLLSGEPHAPVEDREGKHSPQPSPLTPQSGVYRAASLGASLSLRRSSPGLDSPASQVSPHNGASLPFVSGAVVEESLPDLRTTPVLAVPSAQELMYSSLGFIQHLNRPDVTAAKSLDSLTAGGYLGMPSSLHYLSVLVRNPESMVCLQPVQDTTPPSGVPNASGQGVASTQGMVLFSSSLGFSQLGPSSLVKMSPSNVILVKPVLVFLPADKPVVPMPSSTEEEAGHKASLPFTNNTVLGLVTLGDSQEQPVETSPTLSTIRNSTKANTLSTNAHLSDKQAISGPVLNAPSEYVAEASWVRSNSAMTVFSHYGLKEPSARTTSKNQGEEFPSSALESQELEENNPVLLPVGTSVEHHVSITPPVVVSLQQSPKSLPAPTSLHSLMEPSGSQRLTIISLPTSRATEKPQQGFRMVPMLHTESRPHGSMTPITSFGKNVEGPLSSSSAGNVELPLETEQHFTHSRPTSRVSSSTKLIGKLPVSTQPVPSVVSDFLILSSEQKHKVSEALNYSYSEAVLEFPMATEMYSYHVKTTSSKPSKRHPKSPMAHEGLRSQSVFTPFSADAQIQKTGDRPEDIMSHQVLSRPPADVRLHFAKSTPKHSLTTLKVSGKASLANTDNHMGQRVNAEETNKNVRDTEIHNQTEATGFTPTLFGRDSGHLSTLLVVAELKSKTGSPYGTQRAGDVQRGVNPLSSAPVPLVAHKDLAVSPTGGKTSRLETANGNLFRLDPTAISTSEEEDTLLKQRGGEHDGPSASGPAGFRPPAISFEDDHLETPRLLGDDQTQKAGSSLPRPGGTPSSAVSIVLNASTFLMTTLSSGAGADGVGWISDQTSHLQTLPQDTSETFLNLRTQIQPTPESLSDAPEATAEQDALVGAAGEFNGSRSYTMGEQVAGMKDATKEADDPVAALLQDSDWKARHRRLPRSDDVFLDGFAVVSDDSCSSGNYSTEMSLHPGAAGSAPSSPDSFLALIVVQDNNSQPTLRIESCCVTPTSRPTGPGAACCLSPRSPLECGHIQFHRNGKSGMASFTIQVFQMLNHSVAYLHCELSICLSEQGGCEQGCLENRETLSRPSDRSSYRTRHNLISFGPVWKAQTEVPPGSAAGSDTVMLNLLLLGSFTGAAFLVGITTCIWLLHQTCKTKMADNSERQGSYGP